MREAVIVSSVRTPVGRAFKGTLRATRPDELGAVAIKGALERVAKRFGITREAADEFSLRSHQKALAAIQAGRFEDETVPVPVSFTSSNGNGHVERGAVARPVRANSPHKPLQRQEVLFKTDEGPRTDTSLEALGSLKPAFHAKGAVTAGNSSQMSDGAAAAVVMSAERAQALGIKPLARY